ncbi:mitochondrial sodium/calcium exchanger protein-like [Drosophila guanche]|uniref:Blast:Sodium/potassium/calcium exchanger 6, mitochondrial n=1 Tax=Drosophila guanche TaxID=7266 RepID=A0A3B0JG46_DROGU|nr:mitochondrial sodium/calcium exchanger protein-like [Drosophila guanche]SPP74320.1 blast:Sodium/potassium/calcium exchanger 6%2C mitochondrial [Drosophila guanche]
MSENLNKSGLTVAYEFSNYLSDMSCMTMMRLPYGKRCKMAIEVKHCEQIMNIFNYFRMMYCSFNIHDTLTEICMVLVFILICLAFLELMSSSIRLFFTPALKIVSVWLHMNEYLTGVTLLSFGNAIPDIIGNLAPIRANAAIFSIVVGNALVIILLSGGMICFLKPFKLSGPSTTRDLLFLLLSVELARYIILFGGKVTIAKSAVMISIYIIYVSINVIDLLILRHGIKKLRRELHELLSRPPSAERDQEIAEKRHLIYLLKVHDEMIITDTSNFRRNLAERRRFIRGNGVNVSFFTTSKSVDHHERVDFTATGKMLHNERNPKNLYLFSDFLGSLNPIDMEEWQLAGWCWRSYLIIGSPLVFLLLLLIPYVDYEKEKHGWSKLLNCMQIVLAPFFYMVLVHSLIVDEYDNWYLILQFSYAKWSFLLTVPLAIAVFAHSRTDVPPFYHIIFVGLSFTTSIVNIWVCTCEIEVLTSVVANVFHISANFMAITIGSLTISAADLITNATLALQGYEKMVFAAIIGGPLLNNIMSIGMSLWYNESVRQEGKASPLYGYHGENCYIFIMITIVGTLCCCFTFNFFIRRSAGIFLWVLFLLFFVYTAGMEWGFVHGFNDDLQRDPQ